MFTLLLATAFSCALVVMTPGPGVLTVLHLGTSTGRRTAAYFLLGHLSGDLLWALLALIALRAVQFLSPVTFTVLTVTSALYLVYLGIRALAAASAPHSSSVSFAHHPVGHGILFGLTNPKSYPVTLTIFASVIASRVDLLTPATVPLFLAASGLGCIAADGVLVWIVGLRAIRRLYARAAPWITRGVAVLFFGFAVYSIAHVV